MKRNKIRYLALILVSMMLITACSITAPPSSVPSSTPPSSNPGSSSEEIVVGPYSGIADTYDFFADKYQALAGQSNVFQTIEFAEMYNYFLGGRYAKGTGDFTEAERSYTINVKDGNSIFLLGGTWSPELQAAIGYINDVAKEYGISNIYNFDPHLDGKGDDSVVNILADPGPAPAESASAGDKETYETRKSYSQRGDALANALYFWDGYTNPEHPERGDLNGNIENGKKGSDIKAPSIIIWNKGNAGSPVVGELSWTLAEAQNETAFKTSLRGLFDKISTGGKASSLNITPGQYFVEYISARFGRTTSEDTLIDIDGNTIKAADGSDLMQKDWLVFPQGTRDSMFEVVTYEELRGILDSEGNYTVLIGGLWCPNCHSTLRAIYDNASAFNIGKIYYFDPELDSSGNNTATSLRNSNRTLVAPYYIDTFNNVLVNVGTGDLKTRFDIDYDNFITSIEIRKAEGRLIEGDPEDTAANYDANGKLTDTAKMAILLRNGANDGYSIYEKIPGKTSAEDDYAPVENAEWASRIHYPFMFTYNKDHKDASGNPAPVINIFQQLWVSGGGSTPNPGPNSYGRNATIYGRIVELTEYALNDSSKATATHNAANNVQSPKTNELVLASFNPPLAYDESGFDPRGVNTPIVSRNYWVGLLDIFGEFTSMILEAEVARLEATGTTNEAVQAALTEAHAVLDAVNSNRQEAKAWIGEKLAAPLAQERLSASGQIVPYKDYSGDLAAAYDALVAAAEGIS